MQIKAFIFDLDGVIADTAIFHYQAWKKILKEKFNLDYTLEEGEALKGLSRENTLLEFLKLKSFSRKLSEQEIKEVCDEKNDFYKELLKSNLSVKNILPGISTFVKKAKEANIKLAIASSSHNAPMILKSLELFNYFDYIVNPADVKVGKPNPEIFLNAAKHFNLDPKECVGIEDAIAGARAIKAANMNLIAISQSISEEFDSDFMLLKSTRELNFEKIMNYFSLK
ncbi:beta-phosphoglucomutase [Mycoplasmopsis synoviae]|uniref:beta-phosphoglucomutase n=1 Tax=Mycoplasmopsis synoviae TaxID=2109 RepID=UPI0003710B6F|nr:beta-phosphoglucomutase [Mycoplasmopsis synoviae]AKB10885.1 beta-phosphoglucomutase [Mycoplasmopsis synoviae ATCC 25204]